MLIETYEDQTDNQGLYQRKMSDKTLTVCVLNVLG